MHEAAPCLTGAVTFALVRPSEPGNIGAAARSLAAFGFSDLVLIDPARRDDEVEQARAVRFGRPVLAAARTLHAEEIAAFLGDFDEIWATSARAGRRRASLTPQAAVRRFLDRGPARLLVVLGPERTGLDLDWLDRCDRLVSIPTPGGPLNLAQAVTLIAYELATGHDRPRSPLRRPAEQASPAEARRRGAPVAPEMRRELVARAAALLAHVDFPTRSLRSHPHRAYLDPLRAGAYSREQARWLLGLLRRLEARLGLRCD